MSNLPVPAHRIADLALLVQEVSDYDQAVEVGQQVVALKDRADHAIKFALGDLANTAVGDGDFDTLRAFSEAVGVTYSSMRQYAATAKAWAPLSRDPEVGYHVFRQLNADPNRHETLAQIVAELPDGTSPTVARAREARAQQLEIRQQASDSAHAKPAYATVRHGADENNPTEQADAIRHAVMQEAKEQERYADPDERECFGFGFDERPDQAEVTVIQRPANRLGVVTAFEQARSALNVTPVSGADINRLRVLLAECYELLAEWEAAA